MSLAIISISLVRKSVRTQQRPQTEGKHDGSRSNRCLSAWSVRRRVRIRGRHPTTARSGRRCARMNGCEDFRSMRMRSSGTRRRSTARSSRRSLLRRSGDLAGGTERKDVRLSSTSQPSPPTSVRVARACRRPSAGAPRDDAGAEPIRRPRNSGWTGLLHQIATSMRPSVPIFRGRRGDDGRQPASTECAAFTENATEAGWRRFHRGTSSPSAITDPSDAERFMAERMNATTESVDGSHAAFIALRTSQPISS